MYAVWKESEAHEDTQGLGIVWGPECVKNWEHEGSYVPEPQPLQILNPGRGFPEVSICECGPTPHCM